MMSFFRRLFGSSKSPAESAAQTVLHEGYEITPDPIAEGGQYRLGAWIVRKTENGELRHRLIRADMFSNREEALEAALRKARQLVAEQGMNLFSKRS
jgi:hypothetical protein